VSHSPFVNPTQIFWFAGDVFQTGKQDADDNSGIQVGSIRSDYQSSQRNFSMGVSLAVAFHNLLFVFRGGVEVGGHFLFCGSCWVGGHVRGWVCCGAFVVALGVDASMAFAVVRGFVS
jgi:hypothetical protein